MITGNSGLTGRTSTSKTGSSSSNGKANQRTIMLTLLSLFALLGIAHAGYSGYRHNFGRSLLDHCEFTLGDHTFSLCPVIHDSSKIFQAERLTPDKSVRVVYTFTLFGLSGSLEGVQCPKGTWICMTTFDDRPLDSSRIIPIAGSFSPETSLAYQAQAQASVELDHTLNALILRLHGGFLGRRPQQALIQLYCDENVYELSSPSFSEEKHGIHSFIWRTPHACSRVVSGTSSFSLLGATNVAPLNSESDSDDSAPSDESQDESQDEKKQDIFQPGTDVPRPSRLFAILILPGLILVIVVVGVFFLPTGLRRCFNVYIKPMLLSSRARERIFEWDLGVLGEEEDLMVNANEEFEHADEYIPLKPSPKKSHLTDYGSTG